MYFTHYFYVTVTDAAPKCPRAESPASSWPCAELSRRRVGGAELAAPNRRHRVVLDRSVCVCLSVRDHLRNYTSDLRQFLCMLPIIVARSSSSGVVICYVHVLPVLLMTSYLLDAHAALGLAISCAQ